MVFYASTHNGHSMDIKHVALAPSERKKIAGMISKGIQFDDILNSVRDNLSPTEMSRLHLLERRDLKNITNEFHLGKVHCKKDAESLRGWVEMCRQENSELVRFVKYQGEVATDGSQDGRITIGDFMIVLMNDVQVQMLQQYGHHSLNCLDSTRGSNAFDFQLTTLLIIDDYGEVFPVAYCISSKVDLLAMEVFLEHVRTAIGGFVGGAVLMTDDAPSYVAAWNTVMGPPDQHILCTWHVDGNWRKNIAKLKHSTEVKAEVYKTLRVLLETDNKENFYCLLESSLQEMEADEGMTEFLSYFRRKYVSRTDMWSSSFQLDLPFDHNKRLEEFHETLKQVIIQGRNWKVLKRFEMFHNFITVLSSVNQGD